jgi:hypothetical protein
MLADGRQPSPDERHERAVEVGFTRDHGRDRRECEYDDDGEGESAHPRSR